MGRALAGMSGAGHRDQRQHPHHGPQWRIHRLRQGTRKYLAALEPINSGSARAFASGGMARGNFANIYAPCVAVNVSGGQDSRVARQIADAVG